MCYGQCWTFNRTYHTCQHTICNSQYSCHMYTLHSCQSPVICTYYTAVNLLSLVHTTQLSISCHLYTLHSCQSPVTCIHYTVVNLQLLVHATQLSISCHLYIRTTQLSISCHLYILHNTVDNLLSHHVHTVDTCVWTRWIAALDGQH